MIKFMLNNSLFEFGSAKFVQMLHL